MTNARKLLFYAAWALCGPLRAADSATTGGYLSEELGHMGAAAPAAQTQAPSLLPTLLNVAFSLAFVVGLVYVAYWLLLKWRDRQGLASGQRSGLIKVLEKHYLDARHAVAVVEVGDKILTLGLSEQISLLDQVSDPETVEKMRQQAPLAPELMGFREQFQRVGARLRKEEWGRAKQSLRTQAEELEEQMKQMKSRRGGDR